jgi:putative ABC transport system substrate-binding protein
MWRGCARHPYDPRSVGGQASGDGNPCRGRIAADLVVAGIVESLTRPGGNITRQNLRHPELTGKRVELLKEAVPTVNHVAVLVHTADRSHDRVPDHIAAESRALGARLQRVEVDDPGTFELAFGTIATSGADALMIMDNAMFSGHRHRILDFAHTSRLLTVCGGRQYAEAGCLASYSPNHLELLRRAAVFVGKILKGAKPGELPVEQPAKFELFVNLKTAQALGLTLPPALLFQADEVIR